MLKERDTKNQNKGKCYYENYIFYPFVSYIKFVTGFKPFKIFNLLLGNKIFPQCLSILLDLKKKILKERDTKDQNKAKCYYKNYIFYPFVSYIKFVTGFKSFKNFNIAYY